MHHVRKLRRARCIGYQPKQIVSNDTGERERTFFPPSFFFSHFFFFFLSWLALKREKKREKQYYVLFFSVLRVIRLLLSRKMYWRTIGLIKTKKRKKTTNEQMSLPSLDSFGLYYKINNEIQLLSQKKKNDEKNKQIYGCGGRDNRVSLCTNNNRSKKRKGTYV